MATALIRTSSVLDTQQEIAGVTDTPQNAPREYRAQSLRLERIFHEYERVAAVNDISLSVDPGEMIALLGPSGCGKTTLLRIIAGFVRSTRGRVLVDGLPIDHLPASRRRVGIVFQNYALFPHMTVARNVAYGLEAAGAGSSEIAERVAAMLSLTRIESLADRYPRKLSGGQQQRVALARALAIRPRILLLDEPLAALDKALRFEMQFELRRIQRDLGITAILVTHDQDEAMSMASRIAVMRSGQVEQFATASDLYDAPANLFVSSFIGAANHLEGRIVDSDNSQVRVRLAVGACIVVPGRFLQGDPVMVSVRPEQFSIVDDIAEDCFQIDVVAAIPVGPSLMYEAVTPDGLKLKIGEPRGGNAPRSLGRYYCCVRTGAQVQIFKNDGASPA
ncbi:MAG TPA: ABC transporter ATP-binding protein, partial [Gemmataceae bacterium]|nr:ABC transporter ATP-binding protein [Bauldia sp.]HZZ77698.1 ABC transporter ATP-binding protein [Gemmataceae bacterium]